MKRTITWVVGGLVLILLLFLRNNTDIVSQAAGFEDFGFWSIVPAALTLVLCFWTKEVISALFIGIAAGGIVSGRFNIISEFLLPAVGTESYAQILLVYLWCLGGLIGLWTRTGVAGPLQASDMAPFGSAPAVRLRRNCGRAGPEWHPLQAGPRRVGGRRAALLRVSGTECPRWYVPFARCADTWSRNGGIQETSTTRSVPCPSAPRMPGRRSSGSG